MTNPDAISATRAAFTVDEFCIRNRISKVHLYEQWKRGNGPARMQIGRAVRISLDAEQRWHRELEAVNATANVEG